MIAILPTAICLFKEVNSSSAIIYHTSFYFAATLRIIILAVKYHNIYFRWLNTSMWFLHQSRLWKQISCVLLYNRLSNCKIVFPAIQVTIWIVASIYFHVKAAAQGQVLYWQTGKPYWTLNFEGDCKCIFSQAKYLIIIHSGGSKNSKLKVVLGSIAGAVTLLVIGVLIVLWWQRMHYRPEIFIDVSGLSRSISG